MMHGQENIKRTSKFEMGK